MIPSAIATGLRGLPVDAVGSPGTARGEIAALTSLRGVAAMAVVMQHFSATAQQHATSTIPSLVPHGYVAVDFFFVLSGFIMSYTYAAMFQAGRPGAYSSFLARRVARVVPLNVAVLLLLVLVEAASWQWLGRGMLFHGAWLPFDLPANILMLQGLGIGTNLNGPSWSISVEFAAYLVFPLLLWLVFARRTMVRWLAASAALGGLVALALGQKRLGLSYEGPPLALVRCLAEFTLGMFAYAAYRGGQVRWLGGDRVAAGLVLAVIASLALRCDLPAALLFVPIVVAFALNHGWPARLLCHPVLYFLGVVSYSLYLLHNGVRPFALLLLQHLHPAPLATVPALGFALACSVAVVPLAWLGYVLVERPGRRWSRALLRAG